MTLPANDAFSLGLAHNQPRRSSSRVRTPSLPRRSSSPKISFSPPSTSSSIVFSSQPANGMPAKRGHKRKASARNGSQQLKHNGEATIEELIEEVDARIARERKLSPDSSPDKHNTVKKQIDWEIPRKALHSSIGMYILDSPEGCWSDERSLAGFFTIYLYTSKGNPQTVVIALSSALAVLVPIDILRLKYPLFERAFEKCVGIFMRDSEKKSSNGVIWYILGVNTALIALPLDIAVVSILILSWADTAASTFGRLWGPLTPPLPARLLGLPLAPRKSLAGFIAASLTGAAAAAGFWTYLGPMRDNWTWSWDAGVSSMFSGGSAEGGKVFSGWAGLAVVTVCAGLFSGVAEALDLGSVDDNLSLPIIAGGCLWGLFKVLGWLGDVFL
ncbi:hypothetical protein DFJ58DRAFT_716199 [Suillus subalutaceus]|uniref:uncharacterized protein n=1 Tax=Suillus subalutaceus TaxID=48586 RepID=UPI001B87AE52|nr:uncharacterized protein DFJ58DRAFT_716199 [Suillus subalutaceus]KAG1855636.1 hypothetical protein DFJ58DRAFT_716199 [Suillus subalutaceus]